MTWEMVLRLIVAYGVETAYKVWTIATTHKEPTEEAWEALRQLSLKDYQSYIDEATTRASANLPPPPQPS